METIIKSLVEFISTVNNQNILAIIVLVAFFILPLVCKIVKLIVIKNRTTNLFFKSFYLKREFENPKFFLDTNPSLTMEEYKEVEEILERSKRHDELSLTISDIEVMFDYIKLATKYVSIGNLRVKKFKLVSGFKLPIVDRTSSFKTETKKEIIKETRIPRKRYL